MRVSARRRAVLAWLFGVLLCAIAIGRAQFTADLSAFLPRSPSSSQQVLVDQLRDGLVSRLILIAVEGGDARTRASLSRQIAATLRGDPQFSAVNNGEPVDNAANERFLFTHRYLLSPEVSPQRFSAEGLHQALGNSLDLLSSSVGLVAKRLLPNDPTGEVAALISQLDTVSQPAKAGGVWASRDGQRTVLVAQTTASGSDTDAQERAIQAVRHAFDTATRAMPAPNAHRLLMTGPGVFSVEMRNTIRQDVKRLSGLSLVLIVALLLTVYRSPRTLMLGLLPVLSGVVAGIAAVSLAFGTVHGLTLGFGTTLIGEAVDYSIYLFVQSAQRPASGTLVANSMRSWIAAYWPTIRLGVLTSICGFASMLLSGFPGLVQLGLYSIAGLTAAALVTRFVLPHLHKGRAAIRDVTRLGSRLALVAQAAPQLRLPLAMAVLAACAALAYHRGELWNHELASLSPVAATDQALDASLRADVGAPDVRYLIVIPADTEQAALEGAEKVGRQLQPLVENGTLGGYESPARYLPSQATQSARLASLPSTDVLAARMRAAVENQAISVKSELFSPFLADVEATRHQPLITRTDLKGTSMTLAVDALLTERAGRWNAMLALRAPKTSGATATDTAQPSLNVAPIRAAAESATVPGMLFVDLKAEADRMYVDYVREYLRLALAGLVAIAALLTIALHSPRRAMQVLAPLVAAVLVVTAGFALAGVPLTILHLVGMLLIIAVGSNYALFFNPRDGEASIEPHTLVSLVIANLATVAGFGVLALSHVPLLETFGLTVAPGAILALVFAAILAPHAKNPALPAKTSHRGQA
jgi:predicted exporter